MKSSSTLPGSRCRSGKLIFRTSFAADRQRTKHTELNGSLKHTYKCSRCGGWHIGHKNKRFADRDSTKRQRRHNR